MGSNYAIRTERPTPDAIDGAHDSMSAHRCTSSTRGIGNPSQENFKAIEIIMCRSHFHVVTVESEVLLCAPSLDIGDGGRATASHRSSTDRQYDAVGSATS